jgi:energy-coupling factor transport system ATP-binding protein
MSAHHSGKILESADRVCILSNGKIAACDTARNIFSNYALLDENGIQPPVEKDIFSVFTTENNKFYGADAAIQITDFSFSYDSNVSFKNINLTVEDNDFIALTGLNGCGKTTLLKNITGLLRPASGDIYIRGKNVKTLSVSDISKEIGFVMQNPDNQLFSASVYEEVSFALKNAGLSKTEIQERVQDALKITGLEDKSAFPFALNRSDRTKTVIACILAMGCKIIILDETDIGQDYRGSVKIMNLARELHSKGNTIIFVTHNMSLVCDYANRLIMMERNGIVMDMRRNE